MANASAPARLVRTPRLGPDRLAAAPAPAAAQRQLAFARDEPAPPASRPPSRPRRAAAAALALFAVATVLVRQWFSNAILPSPSTDAEAALGANAYALLRLPDLRIPASLADTVTSWQAAGYSYLTSATDRHESLVGSTREFVLVVAVLTAALTVGVCRRLDLGWLCTALAVAIPGLPAAAAVVRITSPSAALAAFWLAVAALSAVVVAGGQPRRPGERRGNSRGATGWRNWSLIALILAASAMALLADAVSVLLVLGLLLGFVSMRRLDGSWNLSRRCLAILGVMAALVAAFWLTVWAPSANGAGIAQLDAAGIAVAVGGLVVAAACRPIAWLRPLAIGAVPILLGAAVPGPAQATALLLGLTIVAVLAAGLLDTLLRQDQWDSLRHGQFPVGARRVSAALLVAAMIGAGLLPSSAPTTTSANPDAVVALWLRSQLAPDALVEVDQLSRAQLVRDGLDLAQLTVAGQTGTEADFVLAPISSGPDLPLVAQFGTGRDRLGLHLVVPDADAFAAALVDDQAARSRFGSALASNPNLSLGGSAAAALRAGDVDARLMVGLAGASASARFAIAQFTGSTGDLVNGTILREVTLTDITDLDPTVGASGTSVSTLDWLMQFFEMQQPPYQPLSLRQDVVALTVRYAAPSPLGLLP